MARHRAIEERFWEKVDRTGECWNWTAARNAFGYGKLRADRERFDWLAHRYSWALHHGVVADDVCVLHRCDNPACVNPTHLFLGDRATNNADKTAKGRNVNPIAAAKRAQTHCVHGHEFTGENTYTDPHGHRSCRTCMREWDRRRRPRRRGGASWT